MSRDRAVRENRFRLAIFLLVAQICGATLPAQAQEASDSLPSQDLVGTFKAYAGGQARVSDFSGLPVPRYSSLKFKDVNGRAGPSADYPVAWTYRRLGLPVVIVRESEEWRKIRDPQGDEVWVHRSQLAGERTAITTTDGAIRKQANAKAGSVANFAAGAIVRLTECGETWCRVEAQGRRGFLPRTQLWGADDLPPAGR
jgi:SH3-like domain-containing protein